MRRFGTDKPDLRYGLEIADVTDRCAGSGFGVFENAIASGGVVRGAGRARRRARCRARTSRSSRRSPGSGAARASPG